MDYIRKIPVSTQLEISSTKYPCTGFCYMAIRDKFEIITKFFGDPNEYKNCLENLIKAAGHRKQNNELICQEGEYIDEATIIDDFPDIYENMIFEEHAISEPIDLDIFTNNLVEKLLLLPQFHHIIINRSNETFLIIKLDEFVFLIIDSHKKEHGTVGFDSCVSYITRQGQIKCVVQIGCQMDDIGEYFYEIDIREMEKEEVILSQKKTCEMCQGSGLTENIPKICQTCFGKICMKCQGKGGLEVDFYEICRTCHGSGCDSSTNK